MSIEEKYTYCPVCGFNCGFQFNGKAKCEKCKNVYTVVNK